MMRGKYVYSSYTDERREKLRKTSTTLHEYYDNPFATPYTIRNSRYCGIVNNHLKHLITHEKASALAQHIHSVFKGHVTSPSFPCFPGTRVFKEHLERFALYTDLNSNEELDILCFDFYEYLKEYRKGKPGNDLTFIACFEKPIPRSENEFCMKLWRLLKKISDKDQQYHKWAEGVSPNTNDKNFAFSFGGISMYMSGFHPFSSRFARRFPYMALVLNTHEQFDMLKTQGTFEKIKNAIRLKDAKLNGKYNPSLTDFGMRSEAEQYDGKDHKGNFHCPVHNFTKKKKTISVTVFFRYIVRLIIYCIHLEFFV